MTNETKTNDVEKNTQAMIDIAHGIAETTADEILKLVKEGMQPPRMIINKLTDEELERIRRETGTPPNYTYKAVSHRILITDPEELKAIEKLAIDGNTDRVMRIDADSLGKYTDLTTGDIVLPGSWTRTDLPAFKMAMSDLKREQWTAGVQFAIDLLKARDHHVAAYELGLKAVNDVRWMSGGELL